MTDPPPWTVIIDNFALSGPVCPGFVDGDADGRCLQGWDTDGDGLCVSDGEPLPPGERGGAGSDRSAAVAVTAE